jgi:hypothetical protein
MNTPRGILSLNDIEKRKGRGIVRIEAYASILTLGEKTPPSTLGSKRRSFSLPSKISAYRSQNPAYFLGIG